MADPEDDYDSKSGRKKRGSRAMSGSQMLQAASASSSGPGGLGSAGGGDKQGEKANKGLRHFSMKVCKKVEEKGQTTYNEVADELVAEFLHINTQNKGEKPAFDEKNIRRRVYDALNVLMAMDIISKEKKDIRWKGLPSNGQHDVEQLERERMRLEHVIGKKQMQLEQLIEQQVTYMNLVRRNQDYETKQAAAAQLQQAQKAQAGEGEGEAGEASGAGASDLEAPEGTTDGDTKIALPFIVINTHHDTYIQCEMTDTRADVMFRFNAPFEISDDSDILKRLGLHQTDDKDLTEMFADAPKLLDFVPEYCRKTS